MTIKEIYCRKNTMYSAVLEDERGNLHQWQLISGKITQAPHMPRAGLLTCSPAVREGFAMSLRAFGHTVLSHA